MELCIKRGRHQTENFSIQNVFYLLLVPKTSPIDKATSDDMEWDWVVLGIVIGAVAFAILCLILGIM